MTFGGSRQFINQLAGLNWLLKRSRDIERVGLNESWCEPDFLDTHRAFLTFSGVWEEEEWEPERTKNMMSFNCAQVDERIMCQVALLCGWQWISGRINMTPLRIRKLTSTGGVNGAVHSCNSVGQRNSHVNRHNGDDRRLRWPLVKRFRMRFPTSSKKGGFRTKWNDVSSQERIVPIPSGQWAGY